MVPGPVAFQRAKRVQFFSSAAQCRTALGADSFASSPAEFGQFIVEYAEKWCKVIRAGGIEAE